MSLENAILGMTAELKRLNDLLASGGANLTAPAQIAGAGAEPVAGAQADSAIEGAKTDAKPEVKKAPAKTTTPPATDKKPAGNVKVETAKAPDAAATKGDTKASTVTMTQVQQAVVKLVTKIGRDGAVAYMQKNFGSPNVSGLDTSKHSYDDVLAKVAARIKEADAAPAEG